MLSSNGGSRINPSIASQGSFVSVQRRICHRLEKIDIGIMSVCVYVSMCACMLLYLIIQTILIPIEKLKIAVVAVSNQGSSSLSSRNDAEAVLLTAMSHRYISLWLSEVQGRMTVGEREAGGYESKRVMNQE